MRSGTAVFTIVFNESFFLPIWLAYYRSHFAAEDVYVLDNCSDDGSTEGLDCNVERVKGPGDVRFDHRWLADTVTSKQAELLKRYNTVLFTEADEIVFPRGLWSLTEYAASFAGDYVRCNGYEIQHYPSKEAPYCPEQKIFAQRSYWFRSPTFDKPLISRTPLVYEMSFHHATPSGPRDDSLILFHLHRLDRDLCLARHRWRRTLNLCDDGQGKHNFSGAEELDSWFKGWFLSQIHLVEAIPEDVKIHVDV